MSSSNKILKRMDTGGKATFGKTELIESRYYCGTDCFASSQGITTDGKYYYCTGTVLPFNFHGLSKIDMQSGKVVMKREKYLPEELAKQGFNHYGGCTYFENNIYVAIEDKDRAHPCLGVFSAETLEFTGKYKILGPEIQPNGNLPWCAADKENRLIYTGYFDHCDHINVFSIDDLKFIKHISIDRVVEKTQGAEMWNGLIYITCHDTWGFKHIYSIDPATGKVLTVMERSAGKNIVESEGMTICPMDDGSFFHQLDVIYPFGLAIRRYSATEDILNK